MTRLTWLTVAVYATACWLGWPQVARSHGSITTTVLFDREIVRILDSHCVMCHSDQSLAFPLMTYEQTWLRGRDIRTQILRRHMPPWSAVAGYGEFLNGNNLTVRETQFMVSWVEGLGPRNAGNVFLNVARPDTAPAEVRATAHVGHWLLGEPDLSRQLAATRIEQGKTDFDQRIVIDLGLDSERLMRALEYQPGDRRVVRAATFFVEATGQWLGSWTPWYGFVKMPDGVAVRLPARSRIVAEVRYRGADLTVVDQGTIGLHFDRASAAVEPDLAIDAQAISADTRRASVTLTSDTRVWALRPELAPGIASMEVAARTRDGGTEILLLTKNPSTEWPTPYIMKTPRLLRRGTEIVFVVRRSTAADNADVRVSRAASRGLSRATSRDRLRLTISRY